MKLAVIIPTLEPNYDLVTYIDELLQKSTAEVIVVNDGSSPNALYVFEELSFRKRCTVLSHTENIGKGASLKTAISYIRNYRSDIEGVVTVDANGQHSVADVLHIMTKLKEYPEDLVLGVRLFNDKIPKCSMVANFVSAKIVALLCGIKLEDTQTGLRAIGKQHFDWLLSLKGERYKYEMNMLLYSKKKGIAISVIEKNGEKLAI